MKLFTLITPLLLGLQSSMAMNNDTTPLEAKLAVTFETINEGTPFLNQYRSGDCFAVGETIYKLNNHPIIDSISLLNPNKDRGVASSRGRFTVKIETNDEKSMNFLTTTLKDKKLFLSDCGDNTFSLSLNARGDMCAMSLDRTTNRKWLTVLNEILSEEKAPLPAEISYKIFHSMGTGTPDDGSYYLNECFNTVDLDKPEAVDSFKNKCQNLDDPFALPLYLTELAQASEYFTNPSFTELYINLYEIAKGKEESISRYNAYHTSYLNSLKDFLKTTVNHIVYITTQEYLQKREQALVDQEVEKNLPASFELALKYAFEAENQDMINKLVQLHSNPSTKDNLSLYNGPNIGLNISTIAYLVNEMRNLNK